MTRDDDMIRLLLEESVEDQAAPAQARTVIDRQIGSRELVLGMLELFTIVPATIVRDFLAGSRKTSTTPEETQ